MEYLLTLISASPIAIDLAAQEDVDDYDRLVISRLVALVSMGNPPANLHRSNRSLISAIIDNEVQFEGGNAEGVRFKGCIIVNMRFHNCTLVNVVFENCNLINAVFSNVVLRDVTITNCTWHEYTWSNDRRIVTTLNDEVFGHDATAVGIIPRQIADSRLSRTEEQGQGYTIEGSNNAQEVATTDSIPETNSGIQRAQQSNEASTAVEVMRETGTIVIDSNTATVEQAAPPATQVQERYKTFQSHYKRQRRMQPRDLIKARWHLDRTGTFPLEHLSDNVLDIICGMLLIAEALGLVDIPDPDPDPDRESQLQTTYVPGSPDGGGQRESRVRSTYRGTNKGDRELRTGIHTAILYVSKRIRDRAVKVLYGQPITFAGSAEGAVAWLHDRSHLLRVIKDLTFIYRFKSTYGIASARFQTPTFPRIVHFKTFEAPFRHLCNALVHKCSGLNSFTLKIQKEFWEGCTRLPNVGLMMETTLATPLEHIFRLAPYDIARSQKYALNNGVHLHLHIDESDHAPERIEFMDRFLRYIEAKRARRRRIAGQRECICMATTYGQCCFVDLPENERIGGGPRRR